MNKLYSKRFQFSIIGYRILFILFDILFLIWLLLMVVILFVRMEAPLELQSFALIWPLIGLLVGLLTMINVMHFRYDTMMALLRAKDREALADYLEERVYGRNRFYPLYITILINSYIILSKSDRILLLEKHVRARRPRLAPRYGIYFGSYYFINREDRDAQHYFDRLRINPRCRFAEWAHWAYAFSLMHRSLYVQARSPLMRLSQNTRDPLVLVVTLYLLNIYGNNDRKAQLAIEAGKIRYHRYTSTRRGRRALEYPRCRIIRPLLAGLIDSAIEWVVEEKFEVA